MQAIETTFDGHRFRSRAEARWAVVFKRAHLRYQYEHQGYVVDDEPYLVDFRLPTLDIWIEIKGEEPTDAERAKCAAFATRIGKSLLLIVGAPSHFGTAYVFPPGGTPYEVNPIHGLLYAFRQTIKRGIDAARAARFEHGEQPRLDLFTYSDIVIGGGLPPPRPVSVPADVPIARGPAPR